MKKFKWTDKAEKAFNDIKKLLCKAQPHYASLGFPFHNTAAHT